MRWLAVAVLVLVGAALLMAILWKSRKQTAGNCVTDAIQELDVGKATEVALQSAEQHGVKESIPSLFDAATALQHGLGSSDEGQDLESAADMLRLVAGSGNRVERADALAQLAQVEESRINRQKYWQYQQKLVRQENALRQRQQIRELQERQRQQQPVAAEVPRAAAATPIRNDTQNVHDSLVVASIKQSLNSLPSGSAYADYQAIRSEVPLTDRAKQVLDTMMANHIPLSAYDKTESEILSSVWQRIQHPSNQDKRSDLKEMLGSQLNDCYYEGGGIVCATGRVGRVLQTLEVLDTDNVVSLKPKWAIESEVQAAGSAVYQRLFDACSEAEKVANSIAADDASPDQLQMQQDFQNRYRNELTAKFQQDYDKILTNEQIQAHVETLVETI